MTDRNETIADIVAKWLPHFKKYADAHNDSAGYDMAGDAVSALEEVLEACGQGNQQEPKKPFDPAEFEKAVSVPNGWSSVADHVAEIRRMRGDYPIGNAAKLRDALEGCAEVAKTDMANYMYANDVGEHKAIKVWSSLIGGFCDRALAAPPRNCDVGTTEEQKARMADWCHRTHCGDCPFCTEWCALSWANAPYDAAQEGGE